MTTPSYSGLGSQPRRCSGFEIPDSRFAIPGDSDACDLESGTCHGEYILMETARLDRYPILPATPAYALYGIRIGSASMPAMASKPPAAIVSPSLVTAR